MGSPSRMMEPLERGIRPVMAPSNSLCPLPSTPCYTNNLTIVDIKVQVLDLYSPPFSSFTSRCCKLSITSPPGSFSGFSISNLTARPTIISASSCSLTSATSTVPMYVPLLSTVQRSETSLISLSLWVISRMVLPSAGEP